MVGTGKNLMMLKEALGEYRNTRKLSTGQISAIIIKLAHQVQIAIVQALLAGNCEIDSPISLDLYLDINHDTDAFGTGVIEDLNEFLNALCNLCSVEQPFDLMYSKNVNNSFNITYSQEVLPDTHTMVITDVVYDQDFVNNVPPFSEDCKYNIDKNNLEYFLNYIFRKPSFRDGQFDVVRNSLLKKDSIVLLPTGAGKSIAFQLAGMLSPGITFVVSPLVSLMDDQIDNLTRNGVDRATEISSSINYLKKRKLQYIISQGDYNTVYLTPERLQIENFRSTLKATVKDIPIPLFVIDEAHCLSEWGHDFRTAYLNLGRIIREYCHHGNRPPTIVALTGTASDSVLKDVQIQLSIPSGEGIITPYSFDREELHYAILPCNNGDKYKTLCKTLDILPKHFDVTKESFFKCGSSDTYGGIVFCPHVNGDYGVWEVYNELLDEGYDCEVYSGGHPKNYLGDDSWDKVKRENADRFKNNERPILVATNAFGMGIDKPNIRYVIHYNMPQSVEAYYQETGRAGRNREISWCYMIPSFNKTKTPRFDSEDAFSDSTIITNKNMSDDLDRIVHFHRTSFKGIPFELEIVKMVLKQIDQSEKNTCNVNFSKPYSANYEVQSTEDAESNVEKAIYRLLLLGVISDYTKNKKFEFNISVNAFERELVKGKYLHIVNSYSIGRVQAEKERITGYDSISNDTE